MIPAFVVVAGLPVAGAYSAALDVDVATLITRERTTHVHAVTAITLSLAPDGAAGAEVWSLRDLHALSSRFDPRGASDLREKRRERGTFQGRWAAHGDGWRLTLHSTGASPEALTLECRTGTTKVGPALGCELLAAPDWLLVPGSDAKEGRRGWLLLGKTPGLWVTTRQGFHDPAPHVRLREAEHPASEEDLTGSWRLR
jgi:hypothetical protein